MSLSIKAVTEILVNVKKSYYHDGEVLDLDGTNFGATAPDVSTALAHARDMVIVFSSSGKSFIVHKENKKTIKKLSEKGKADLPKGAIAFPNPDLIILDVFSTGNLSRKERSKFLSRLIGDGVEDIVVEDSAFWLDGHNGEWHAIAYADRNEPDVLKWGVRDNDLSSKWIMPCENQEAAFAKLRAIAKEETIKIARKAA